MPCNIWTQIINDTNPFFVSLCEYLYDQNWGLVSAMWSIGPLPASRSPQVYLGCLAQGSSIPPFGLAVSLTMVLATVRADMLVPALRCTLGTLTSIPFVAWFIVLIPWLLAGFGPYFSWSLASNTDRVEPVDLEVLKGVLVHEEVATFANPHSDTFVEIDNGRVGKGHGGCK